jgi:hypothetical protein
MVVSSLDCHHRRYTAVRQESSGPCLLACLHRCRNDLTNRIASSQLVTERASSRGPAPTSGVVVTVIRTPPGGRSSTRRTQTAVLSGRELFTAECLPKQILETLNPLSSCRLDVQVVARLGNAPGHSPAFGHRSGSLRARQRRARCSAHDPVRGRIGLTIIDDEPRRLSRR